MVKVILMPVKDVSGKGENIRRITELFVLAILSEIIILVAIIIQGYFVIDNPSERIKTIGSVVASLITLLLTTVLVYYNFYQMPELKFMDFYINPLVGGDDSARFHDTTAKEDFVEYGRVRTDIYSMKFPFRVRKLGCEKPRILSVECDIMNLGLITANINQIRYYMTYPRQARPLVRHSLNSPLPPQETTRLAEVRIPKETEKIWNYALKDGIIMLKFEAIAGTGKCSKQVWIRISDDLKVIEWSESKFLMLLSRFKANLGKSKEK